MLGIRSFMVMIAHLNHECLGHHPASLHMLGMFVLLCFLLNLFFFVPLSSSPYLLPSLYMKYCFL